MSWLLPRIVLSKGKAWFEEASSGNQVKDASIWLEKDLYTQVPRYRCIRWLGIDLFKIPYRETIEGNYFVPADDLVALLEEMQQHGAIPALGEESRVLEPGCNVGRNLFHLQEAFGSQVWGVDISANAIRLAQEKVWRDRRNCEFARADVLETDFFEKFEDGFFDLVLTRWHLIHLPQSERKRKYIRELTRVGKTVLLLEPQLEGRKGNEFYEVGKYCLAWDDWAQEYGFSPWRSPAAERLTERDHTRVFDTARQETG